MPRTLVALSWAAAMTVLWLPGCGADAIACRPWTFTQRSFGCFGDYPARFSGPPSSRWCAWPRSAPTPTASLSRATLREKQGEVKRWLTDSPDLVTSMNAFGGLPAMKARQEKTRYRLRCVTRAVNQALSARTIPAAHSFEAGFLPAPAAMAAAAG
jgi:hypothetical protein